MATPSTAAPAPSTIRIFKAVVISATRLNPHFARIVIGGGDIPEFESIGPDQFIYVFVPRPGETDPRVEHGFSWDEWRQAPEADRQVGRYYTVRKHDPVRSELTLDFVIHGDGPLTTWATTAKAGDRVAIWGPRKGFAPPRATKQFLLFADEAGLPALASILESLPAGATARALVEIPAANAEVTMESAADVELSWLHRDGPGAGETTLLSDAIRAEPWPAGQVYAWGGGEFRAMNAIRKYLRDDRGLSTEDMSVIAYWRHRDHIEDEGEKS